MSQRNIAVVRRINEAFNSGDIEAILALIDPDFQTSVPPQFSPEPDTYRGHDGMRRYFDSFHDAMSEIRFHQERLREAGTAVIVELRLTARGRTTGIAVEQHLAQVWTVSDGRAVEVRNYSTWAEALESMGVAE